MARGDQLKNGITKSCGCLRSEYDLNRPIKHGYARKVNVDIEKRAMFTVWAAMKQRCLNPKEVSYKNYGGRGISICQEWVDSFDIFIKDVGDRPSKFHTLDRKDNDGNYERSNVIWALRKDQARNRRTNRNVIFNGKKYIITDLAREIGINPKSMFEMFKNKGDEESIKFYQNKYGKSPHHTFPKEITCQTP